MSIPMNVHILTFCDLWPQPDTLERAVCEMAVKHARLWVWLPRKGKLEIDRQHIIDALAQRQDIAHRLGFSFIAHENITWNKCGRQDKGSVIIAPRFLTADERMFVEDPQFWSQHHPIPLDCENWRLN